MNYETLAAERADVQLAVDALVTVSRSAGPRPDEACRILSHLAALVGPHLAMAEPIVYATADAARGGRHHAAALASLTMLEALKDEWSDYLYRWDRAAITDDWARFGDETARLLGPLRARIRSGLAILFSLAVHLKVLAPSASYGWPVSRL